MEIVSEELKWFPTMNQVGRDPRFGKIYTSDEIKNDFIIVLKESKKFKNHPKALLGIQKLINNNILIPAQKTKTIIGYFFARWPIRKRHIFLMGTHIVSKDKDVIIYIYLDSHFLSYGLYDPNDVVKTTIHELAHNYAYEDTSSYYQNYSKKLKEFYTAYFSLYFNIPPENINKKTMKEFILLLMKIEKFGFNKENAKSYTDLIYDFSDMTKEPGKRREKVRAYFRTINSYFQNFSEFRANYGENPVVMTIFAAYNKAFKLSSRKINSLCIQELIYSSEVLAIMAEYNHDIYVLNFLSQLK